MKNSITKLKVAITSDHAGFDLKQKIRLNLENLGFGILDLGPDDSKPVDYPDFGKAIADKIVKGDADTLEILNDEDSLYALKGVEAFPMRVKCATLAWHTFKSAVENK